MGVERLKLIKLLLSVMMKFLSFGINEIRVSKKTNLDNNQIIQNKFPCAFKMFHQPHLVIHSILQFHVKTLKPEIPKSCYHCLR